MISTTRQAHAAAYDPQTDDRFLSRAGCDALAKRIIAMGHGGGDTRLSIDSRWTGNLRWARNDIATGGNVQATGVHIDRRIRGAGGGADTNALSDDALRVCIARAEAMILLRSESPDNYPDVPPPTLPHANPQLWFDSTIHVDDAVMTATVDRVITPSVTAGVLSAGYIELIAGGHAVITTQGLFRYYPSTTLQYSVTVRDVKDHGSGWAGVDWNDWGRLDTVRIAQTALDKCLRSRNPVAIEPGRYTAILEPQAVYELVSPLVAQALDRRLAERGLGPFADPLHPGDTLIGQPVVDPRLTLSSDPMDPDCGFLPFDPSGEPYQAVNWIERGVLSALAYNRSYAQRQLGKDAALPNSRAFRLRGDVSSTSTIDDMVANTTRGLLITRFSQVQILDLQSMLCTGLTRDGLWLVEHGKISKPVKNFRFTESPLFILNKVEQIGRPERVFSPGEPAVVAPMTVSDFSFTSLVDAV
jgi:predicted Zn-dependent protease